MTSRTSLGSRQNSAQTDSGVSGLVDPLLAALDQRLAAFETSLNAFSWPTDAASWRDSVLPAYSKDITGKLTAYIPPVDEAVNPYKFFSKSTDLTQQSGIAPGTYSFDLALGYSKERISVSVAKGDTWGTVLSLMADAINAAPLSARADVIYQNTAFAKEPGLAQTGYILALSVNPGARDQSMALSDVQGHLLDSLGFSPAQSANFPLDTGRYLVTGLKTAVASRLASPSFDGNAPTSLASGRYDFSVITGSAEQPTTYVSKVFDPAQATSLGAGTYTFSYRFGDEQKTMSVTVQSGWTWGDVMRAVAANINAQTAWTANSASAPPYPQGVISAPSFSQPGLAASLESSPIPSETTAGVYTDGQVVSVATQAPFAGTSLTLTDGSGGLLTALGLTTPLKGQAMSITVQTGDTNRAVMQNLANTIGSSVYGQSASISTQALYSGAIPGTTIVRAGDSLRVTQTDLRIGEFTRFMDGAGGLLAALGIDSQTPGQDGEMIVDGRTYVSANNLFAVDQGRTMMSLNAPFGDTLPLGVVKSIDSINNNFSDIINKYNNLQSFLNANSNAVSASLSQALAAPLRAQLSNLRWMGVEQTRKTNQAWVVSDAFHAALASDPARAGQTLAGPQHGLITGWKAAASATRKAGLASFLAEPGTSPFSTPSTAIKTEFDLEKKNRLLDLLG